MRDWKYLRNGETLVIDAARCVGCGACVEVCPHAVIELEAAGGRKLARVARRGSCMECGACALNCPPRAIAVARGVGCAAAIINGTLRGTAPSCDCGGGEPCCGD